MPAPSELPEWASGGSAAITEPTLSEKQLGWTDGEEPPAGYFNWWMNLVFLWISWFSSKIATPTIHYIGSASEPIFTSGWNNNGVAGSPKCCYFTDVSGTVHLDGYPVKAAGAAVGDTLFTLPAGARPLNVSLGGGYTFNCPAATGVTTQITIDNTGAVKIGANPQGAFYLTGIKFNPNVAAT